MRSCIELGSSVVCDLGFKFWINLFGHDIASPIYDASVERRPGMKRWFTTGVPPRQNMEYCERSSVVLIISRPQPSSNRVSVRLSRLLLLEIGVLRKCSNYQGG